MLPGSCGAARRSVPCPPMPRPCAPASGVRAAWAWCSHSVEAVSDGFHACSWCVAMRPAVRSRPAVSEGLPWVLRGSAHCDGTSGLGDTAASFPAGGGPVREASERLPDRAWKPVPGPSAGRGAGSGAAAVRGGACPVPAARRGAWARARRRVWSRVRKRAPSRCRAVGGLSGGMCRRHAAAKGDFGRQAGERSPGRARERTGVKQGVQGGGYPVARLRHALRMAENHRSTEVGPIDSRTSPPTRP